MVPRTIYSIASAKLGTVANAGEFGWQSRTWRNYFHPVYDQFNEWIWTTGIPCDEVVRIRYGPKPNTSPGPTGIYEPEKVPEYSWANWPGGIAVKDVLGCKTDHDPNSLYEQDIYVGGWLTIPMYLLYVQPMENDPWPCIWKDPKF